MESNTIPSYIVPVWGGKERQVVATCIMSAVATAVLVDVGAMNLYRYNHPATYPEYQDMFTTVLLCTMDLLFIAVLRGIVAASFRPYYRASPAVLAGDAFHACPWYGEVPKWLKGRVC
jgi:hypothetical protein